MFLLRAFFALFASFFLCGCSTAPYSPPSIDFELQPIAAPQLDWPADTSEIEGQWGGIYFDGKGISLVSLKISYGTMESSSRGRSTRSSSKGSVGQRTEITCEVTYGASPEGYSSKTHPGDAHESILTGTFDPETRGFELFTPREAGSSYSSLSIRGATDGTSFFGEMSSMRGSKYYLPEVRFVAHNWEDYESHLLPETEALVSGRYPNKFAKMTESGIDEKALGQWLQNSVAELSKVPKQANARVRERVFSRLLSDQYFKPFFGKAYDSLEAGEHRDCQVLLKEGYSDFRKLQTPEKLRNLPSPGRNGSFSDLFGGGLKEGPLTVPEARDFAKLFDLKKSDGVEKHFVEVKVQRAQRRWLAGTQSYLSGLAASSAGLSLANELERKWNQLLYGLPAEELSSNLAILAEVRANSASGVLANELSGFEHLAPSLQLLLVLETWADENEKQLNLLEYDERNTLLHKHIVLKLSKLGSWLEGEEVSLLALGDSMEALAEASGWYREILANLPSAKRSDELRATIQSVQPSQEQALDVNYELLEAGIMACSTYQELEGYKKRYLGFPVKASSEIGGDLVTIIRWKEDEIKWEGEKQYYSTRELSWMPTPRQIDVSKGIDKVPLPDEVALAILREYSTLPSGEWIGPRKVRFIPPGGELLEGMIGKGAGYASFYLSANRVRNISRISGANRFYVEVAPVLGGDLYFFGQEVSAWTAYELQFELTPHGWRAPNVARDLKGTSGALDFLFKGMGGR